MPLIYRPQSHVFTDEESDPDAEHIPAGPAAAGRLAPTDADDSIVLSDLVRTGEASRLRRRGAMRLDHTRPQPSSSPQSQLHRTPSVIMVHEPPSWDPSDPEDVLPPPPPPPPPLRRSTRMRPTRRPAVDDEHREHAYTLFCGGEMSGDEYGSAGEDDCTSKPFTPSILPEYPPVRLPSSISSGKQKQRRRRTNGCGALLHTAAAPRRPSHPPSSSSSALHTATNTNTWHGPATGAAPDALAPLEAMYFDDPRIRARIRAGVREGLEGLGCAACGNAVGTRVRVRRAAGQGHGQGRGDAGGGWTHTFFAGAVSSRPAYTFPSSSSSSSSSGSASGLGSAPASFIPRPAPRPETLYDSSDTETQAVHHHHPHAQAQHQHPPGYALTLLDRLITASPTPLSDEEREAYLHRAAVQPRHSYGFRYHGGYAGYGLGLGDEEHAWAGGGGRGGGGGGVYDADGEVVPEQEQEPESPKGEMQMQMEMHPVVLVPER
ncbi:hypothetical protein LshimejAT787_0112290 [Lyophyllum shimeji]|uniref:Uncharacterized protein n=1 Tax=Lyophyllum shimeji TaxID=47721 RepID=A0A9P3UKC8_LYOSH|nr:hypothetical protein LshimejAT787_0112290 [Lyophyllum shimeji]